MPEKPDETLTKRLLTHFFDRKLPFYIRDIPDQTSKISCRQAIVRTTTCDPIKLMTVVKPTEVIMIRFSTLTLAVSLTLAGSSALALSSEPPTAADYRVNAYELTTDAGRKAALRRIDHQVSATCQVDERLSLPQRRAAATCHREEMERVLTAIGDHRLIAIYNAETAPITLAENQ